MSCIMQAKSAFLCVGGECFYNLIMAKKLAKLHCLGQNKIESYFSRIGVNAMNKNVALYNEMIAFFAGDARRCQHFIKVASLAKQLAESEGADAELTELVEAAGQVLCMTAVLSRVKQSTAPVIAPVKFRSRRDLR